MRNSDGMKSKDIVILLKIISFRKQGKERIPAILAHELYIKSTEVSYGLDRNRMDKLIDSEKKVVYYLSLLFSLWIKIYIPTNIW